LNIRNRTRSNQVAVGFSASNGGDVQNHVIKEWYFDNEYHEGGLSNSGGYLNAYETVSVTLDSNTVTAQLMDADGSTLSTQGVNIEFYDHVGNQLNSASKTTDSQGEASIEAVGVYGDIFAVVDGGGSGCVEKP